jgi:protoheme IX farnesyltransferase
MESKGTLVLVRSRAADYVTMMKPELTFLSVLTALAGYFLGADGVFHGFGMMHILVGTALVGGGAGALNQVLERKYDALMKRTEHRPMPAGRLSVLEGSVFGSGLSLAGIAYLLVLVNPLTALLAAVTSATYLYLYTPLKRITPVSTLIGAIPGALPPVMGWTAARNSLDFDSWVLFGILFFWQMPHFLALAWMYRKDYTRAGYRLLTVLDGEGTRTGTHILVYAVLLCIVSTLPVVTGGLGVVYGVSALILGGAMIVPSVRLLRLRSNPAARTLFFASLLYLPALMLAMVIDKLMF